jgi:hypothetical protein
VDNKAISFFSKYMAEGRNVLLFALSPYGHDSSILQMAGSDISDIFF